MTTTSTLPHWDMTVVYPGLDSAEFEQGFAAVVRDVAELGQVFDEQKVMEQPEVAVDDAVVRSFEKVLRRYNEVIEGVRTLGAYIKLLCDDELA